MTEKLVVCNGSGTVPSENARFVTCWLCGQTGIKVTPSGMQWRHKRWMKV